MTIFRRILAALAILAVLGAPRLVTAPTTAQADFCSACADPDVPELIAPWRASLRPSTLRRHHPKFRSVVLKERA